MDPLAQLTQSVQALQTQVNQLQGILSNHRHTGADYSQSISTASSSGGKTYVGLVTTGYGVGTPFPAGWSISSTGTGLVKITHNLNSTTYVPIVTPYATEAFAWICNGSVTANSFEVFTYLGSSSPADLGFYFAVFT